MCFWKSLLDRELAECKHLEFVNRGLKARCSTIFLKIQKFRSLFAETKGHVISATKYFSQVLHNLYCIGSIFQGHISTMPLNERQVWHFYGIYIHDITRSLFEITDSFVLLAQKPLNDFLEKFNLAR